MKQKIKLVERRLLGVRALAGGRACPHAHALYQEAYSDGRVLVRAGNSVHVLPGFDQLNAKTKKQKKRAEEESRPDLYHLILIAAIVNQALEAACLRLDSARGLKESRSL